MSITVRYDNTLEPVKGDVGKVGKVGLPGKVGKDGIDGTPGGGSNTEIPPVEHIAEEDDVITIDLDDGTNHRITANGNFYIELDNRVDGKRFTVTIRQTVDGGFVVYTWFTNIRWHDRVVPTLSTDQNRWDFFWFECDGTENINSIGVNLNLGVPE